MTPKEKAKELVDQRLFTISEVFDNYWSTNYTKCFEVAKKCALIHTEELIKHLKAYSAGDLVIFYREVDKEINNLKQ